MSDPKPKTHKLALLVLTLIPVASMLAVWLSALSFVPVPWPDDSAFYFVAKDFFQWPPRWVMLAQAPFEPTYRIFNFNTMPLYPILLGLGRWIGIDGSFLLKLWPLGFWTATGVLLGISLYRGRLPFLAAALISFGFMMDPALRWASVLVRPESLIGLTGAAIVLGLTLGYPRRFRHRGLWDPTAALLAIAAYAHFNAIHLLFPVVAALATRPKRLFAIGWRTAFYLVPWVVTVAMHPKLFVHQMTTQWKRLAVHNGWLNTPKTAVQSLFQNMGSPESWPDILHQSAILIWIVMIGAIIVSFLFPIGSWTVDRLRKVPAEKGLKIHHTLNLAPAAAWIFGASWLWHTKPEVWFTYYIHVAVWVFMGLATLRAVQAIRHPKTGQQAWKASMAAGALLFSSTALAGVFTYVNISQAKRLGETQSWNWQAYGRLIDCIDEQLTTLEKQLGYPKPFRVWDPTFPDVTIELSRRHPEWELTRTNDFWERRDLAIRHGYEVDAVVVPETVNWQERIVSGPQSAHPEIRSVWMTWNDYFLVQLWNDPAWKPNRFLCQQGRWQAFIFMKQPK